MLDSLDRLDRLFRKLDRILDQDEPAPQPLTELPGLVDLSLYDLLPRLKPGTEPPFHLPSLVDELEQAIAPHKGQRFFWFSVPPRHWKTTTLITGAVKHLLRWPEAGVAYFSHTQSFANKQSREVRRLAARCDLRFSRDSNRQDEWELTTGGGLLATGIDAVPAGRGFRLIIVDDPFKNRAQAQSKADRDRIFNAIEDDVSTRLSPDGCLILVHTRWHPDDAIGRYRKRGWHGTNIEALSGPEENVPLLPAHWPFDVLAQIRRSNPYKFAALYQGSPKVPGDTLFRDPATYEWDDGRPAQGVTGYGVDFGNYAKKTVGHFSVSVELFKVRTEQSDAETKKPIFHYYVTDVQRKHVDAPGFTLTLKSQQSKRPGPMLWHAASSEMGTAQFITKRIPRFRAELANENKVARAQAFAEQWNLGRVFVPTGDNRPEWVDDYVDELTNFTGVNDAADDQVDGSASAFEALNSKAATYDPRHDRNLPTPRI